MLQKLGRLKHLSEPSLAKRLALLGRITSMPELDENGKQGVGQAGSRLTHF